jgi:dTDP-glucose 4,6-dehydratase
VRIVVTGGAGFIGSAYIRHVLDHHPADEIVTLDLLTYAGNLANLDELRDVRRHRFVHGDISNEELVDELVLGADAVVNFAAESHVDRSLLDASAFARTNMMGVVALLNAVRRHGKRLLQVSTDEVYGNIQTGHFSVESDPLLPRSPYAAAKAGGELLCRSYVVSYGADVVITRGCNTIGPRQYPEKLIPLFITNALRDQPLPLYGDGLQVRDWLYVDDAAAAIDLVLRRGRSGEVYNYGADSHHTNIEVVRSLLRHLGKPENLIVHVPDRPGHDRRYALDANKIKTELGWAPARDFDQTLRETIEWYLDHPAWWQAIRDGDSSFAEYYERQYGWRLAEEAAI